MKRVIAICIKNFLSIISIYKKNSSRNQDNKDLQLLIYIIIIFCIRKILSKTCFYYYTKRQIFLILMFYKEKIISYLLYYLYCSKYT